MALIDQCFLHLAGHSSHLGNFKPTHIPVYHTWRFQLSQNQVESEICIFFLNLCRWHIYKLFTNVGMLSIINNKSLSTHLTNGQDRPLFAVGSITPQTFHASGGLVQTARWTPPAGFFCLKEGWGRTGNSHFWDAHSAVGIIIVEHNELRVLSGLFCLCNYYKAPLSPPPSIVLSKLLMSQCVDKRVIELNDGDLSTNFLKNIVTYIP